MIFLTLVVGGATRLTQSGLSIVEWKPVTGVLPPLSENAWQAEFEKYQAIPQYRELNRGMSLERVQDDLLVGMDAPAAGAHHRRGVPAAVFVFLWRAAGFRRACAVRLWAIFGGGALLGAVGWWMVSSGLSGARVSVSQYRLAFHLTLACAIYAAVVVDRAAIDAAGAQRCAETVARGGVGDCGAGAAADLSRCAGRRDCMPDWRSTPGR